MPIAGLQTIVQIQKQSEKSITLAMQGHLMKPKVSL